MTGQYIIIGVVVAVSIAYAVYRVRKAFRQSGDPCQGCAGCALKNARQGRIKQCPDRSEIQKT